METNPVSRIKALGLFMILMCVYLLVFNGVASTDDEQLFITLTEGMTTGRGYSGLPLLGNDRLRGKSGSVEPAHPIAGIPFYQMADIFGLGKAQALFILPSITTALTASLLYLFTLHLGFAEKTALFTGLAYGLGTIAFPYARMNFREPLAALMITFAFFFLDSQKYSEITAGKRTFFLGASLLSLGIAVLTKITTAVILPVYAAAGLAQVLQWKKASSRRYALPISALLIILMVIAVLLISAMPGESVSRFSLRFVNYIRYTLPRLPHDHFWQAIAGLLFSPGKGLFVYSPILLCAFISPFTKNNKNWWIGVFALVLLATAQALIYNDAWWGITWGTRALLPVLPLMMLAATPGMERLLFSKHHTPKVISWGFLVLSILAQASSLFASDPAFLGWATQASSRSVDAAMQWDLSLSPLFRHPWLGWQEKLTTIAWFHLSSLNISALILFIALLTFTLGAGIYLLASKGKRRWIVLLTVLLLSGLIPTTLQLAKADARYYTDVTPIAETRSAICEMAGPEDLVLVDHYLHPFWWHYSNFGCSNPAWAGLPYIHQTALQTELFYPRIADTESLIRAWLQKGTVYLISGPGDTAISYRHELSVRGFIISTLAPKKDTRPFTVSIISQ